MTDEDALFEVWFQLYRAKHWKASRPDRAHEQPSEAFCMGLRGHFHTGWMARSSLHVTYADGSPSRPDNLSISPALSDATLDRTGEPNA